MKVWCNESDESIDPHVCAYDCEIKCFLKPDLKKINQEKCGWSGCWRCEDCFYLLECEFYTEEEMEEMTKRKTKELLMEAEQR